MRVWVEMEEVVSILRRLDAVYGDSAHPYALRVEEIPAAQRDLLEMLVDRILDRPSAVGRVAVPRRLAAELADRFGVKPSAFPLRYPEAIDQVDLDAEQAMMALPFIVERPAREPGDRSAPR
jgi:hypothetical protein